MGFIGTGWGRVADINRRNAEAARANCPTCSGEGTPVPDTTLESLGAVQTAGAGVEVQGPTERENTLAMRAAYREAREPVPEYYN